MLALAMICQALTTIHKFTNMRLTVDISPAAPPIKALVIELLCGAQYGQLNTVFRGWRMQQASMQATTIVSPSAVNLFTFAERRPAY